MPAILRAGVWGVGLVVVKFRAVATCRPNVAPAAMRISPIASQGRGRLIFQRIAAPIPTSAASGGARIDK
jgi:hypothetical protein